MNKVASMSLKWCLFDKTEQTERESAIYAQTASSVGTDPAHIWPAWISHGPDVGRIWANTMLLSGWLLLDPYIKHTDRKTNVVRKDTQSFSL